MDKKTLVVIGAATAIGLAGLGGIGVVSAATNTSSSGPDNSLVAKIADKFHLNRADVQAVFDQNRADHQGQMQQRLDDKLSSAVKDGTITDDQKSKILAKLDELKANFEANRTSMQTMTDDERRAAMKQQHDDLQQWAADNNIPLDLLRPGMGGFRHWSGGPMMHGPEDNGSST